MTDLDIIRTKIGEKTFQEMTSISFYQYLSSKINNVEGFNQEKNRIVLAISNPVFGKLSDDSKIELLKCLLAMGIELK